MKKLFKPLPVFFTLCATLFFTLSCDEENTSPSPEVPELPGVSANMYTLGEQPALLRIAPSDSLNNLRLEFETTRQKGTVELLTLNGLNSRAEITFVKYTPLGTEGDNDEIVISAFDQSGQLQFQSNIAVVLIGEGEVPDCLNLSFSDHIIASVNSEFELNLTENDSYCDNADFGKMMSSLHTGFIQASAGPTTSLTGLSRSSESTDESYSSVIEGQTGSEAGRAQVLMQYCIFNENFDYQNPNSWQNEADIFKQCSVYSAVLLTVDIED